MSRSFEFDNRISLGHVLSFGGMLVALVVWGIRLEARTDGNARDMERYRISTEQSDIAIRADVKQNETAIRTIERSSAGQDAKLALILDALSEIKSRLERGEP